MSNEEKIKKIFNLVNEQSFFVLCTQGEGQPYGSLIAYAFKSDLNIFYFATSKNTRKYKLLSECPGVAVVIDSRCKSQGDFMEIDVLTVTGNATQLSNDQNDFMAGMILLKNRHACLSKFLESEDTVLFRIDATKFFYVNRFEEVFVWEPPKSLKN